MASAKINVNTDPEVKKEVEELLGKMGLTMTVAINIYLKRILMEGGIPFEITTHVPNSVTAQAIQEGRRIARDETVPCYNSVEELKVAMGYDVSSEKD